MCTIRTISEHTNCIKLEGNIWRFLFPRCFIETIYSVEVELTCGCAIEAFRGCGCKLNDMFTSFEMILGKCIFFGHRSLITLTPNTVVSIPVNFVESSVFLRFNLQYLPKPMSNIISQQCQHKRFTQCSFSQSSLKADEKTTKQQYNI